MPDCPHCSEMREMLRQIAHIANRKPGRIRFADGVKEQGIRALKSDNKRLRAALESILSKSDECDPTSEDIAYHAIQVAKAALKKEK